MKTEASKVHKRETAQEVFKKLREQEKIEMLEKTRQIEDAQKRAKAAAVKRNKKLGLEDDTESQARRISGEKKNSSDVASAQLEAVPITVSSPIASPPSMIKAEERSRGGSEGDRALEEKASKSYEAALRSCEDSRVVERAENHRCSRRSSRASIAVNLGDDTDETMEGTKKSSHSTSLDSWTINGKRLRGGCGGGFRSPSTYRKQTEFRAGYETASQNGNGGGCPCGACGGPACSDNPGGGGTDGGCCGSANRPQRKPCKCKCQSCDSFRPLGGCGGQSCGRFYSCAGSSGGRCCFPRNHKRRSGPECCGGAGTSCGGCC